MTEPSEPADSSLLAAVESGDLKQLRALIKAGAEVNESSEHSPLARATELGRTDMVKELLKAGADASFGGIWVPLCVAVRSKQPGILKLLLAAGAKVNAQEEEGDTALMYAAAVGDLSMVKLLVKAGADPKLEDEDGESALIYGREHPPIVKYLKPLSSDETLEYFEELTRKHDALTEAFLAAARAADLPKVKQMLADGMPIGSSGKGKATALHAALQAPGDDMLEFLLQNGAPVDARNEYGRTPLYEVAGGGDLVRAERLIRAGADVNIHDNMGGDTPFLHSVSPTRKHHDMMRLLARHGADVKAVDDYGRSALNLASRWLGDKGEFRTEESDEKAAALRQALIDTGALHPDGNQFTAAAARGDLATVAQMIQDGLPVDTVDEMERTVLYMAVSRRHPDLVKFLLQAGARLDHPNGVDDDEDKHWGGLAMPCPKCGHVFTTIICQRQCPQCNHQFDANEAFGENVHGLPMFVSWGNTYPPLVTAARLGDAVLLKLLLTAGADPNLGKNKITPLMVACYCGQVEAVRILLVHGADPKLEGKTPDRMGEKVSPIGIAAAGRNVELLNLLWDAGVPVTDRKPTLLVAAAFHNDAEAIRQLTAQGADPAAPDLMTRDTPLDIAAKEAQTAAVAALIIAGAPVDPKDARGYTPLMQAMAAVDDHARRKRFPSELQARYLETVRTLLAAGANVNVKFYDMSPLSLAKSARCEPLIELLEGASKGKVGVG